LTTIPRSGVNVAVARVTRLLRRSGGLAWSGLVDFLSFGGGLFHGAFVDGSEGVASTGAGATSARRWARRDGRREFVEFCAVALAATMTPKSTQQFIFIIRNQSFNFPRRHVRHCRLHSPSRIFPICVVAQSCHVMFCDRTAADLAVFALAQFQSTTLFERCWRSAAPRAFSFSPPAKNACVNFRSVSGQPCPRPS